LVKDKNNKQDKSRIAYRILRISIVQGDVDLKLCVRIFF